MQGTLKDAIEYASKNPTSAFARDLATQIKAGSLDGEAQKLGLNLAPIKQSTFGKSPVTAPEPNKGLEGSGAFADRQGLAPVADKLGQGIVDTAQKLNERGQNLINDTVQAGTQDQGKPLADRALNAVAYGAKKGLETITGGVGDIFAGMISPWIPQKVKDAYGEATTQALGQIKDAWNAPAPTPEAEAGKQKIISLFTSLSDKAKENPQVAQILQDAALDALNITALGAGGKAETAVKTASEQGIKTGTEIADNLIKKGAETVDTIGSKITPSATEIGNKGFTNSLDEAKKILNPNDFYTQAEKERSLARGNTTIEGKKFGPIDLRKEVVNPPVTRQTEALSSLVDEGKISSKNLPSQNIEVLGREARISDANIDEVVNRPELNKPFNQKIINRVYDSVFNSAKKDLVFISDSVEQKAYQQVIDVAREEIAKQPKNSAGLRAGIKAFNARMERILGSDIYSGAAESVGNARVTAAKDVRTGLNKFLADNLESPEIKKSALANEDVGAKLPAKSTFEYGKAKGGNTYRAELEREAQLLNARDEIAYRAGRTIDKTKLSQFLKAHPLAKDLLKYGGVAIGGGVLGGGVLKEFGL